MTTRGGENSRDLAYMFNGILEEIKIHFSLKTTLIIISKCIINILLSSLEGHIIIDLLTRGVTTRTSKVSEDEMLLLLVGSGRHEETIEVESWESLWSNFLHNVLILIDVLHGDKSITINSLRFM
jgi:hypothetical protein